MGQVAKQKWSYRSGACRNAGWAVGAAVASPSRSV
jgi:hypothetical protein